MACNSKPNILDICRDYNIRLNRQNKALCPLHKEDSPSFTVYPETQSFYCFGCCAGGDVITLLSMLSNDSVGSILKSIKEPSTRENKIKILKIQQESKTINSFQKWINYAYDALCRMYRENLEQLKSLDFESKSKWGYIKEMTKAEQWMYKLEADPKQFYEELWEVIEVVNKRYSRSV